MNWPLAILLTVTKSAQRLIPAVNRAGLILLLMATGAVSMPSLAAFDFLKSPFKHIEDTPRQKNRVEDLSYGVVLYEFFQKNYFSSMTEILIAEQQQSMPNHQQFAQILMGGIQLSYGMDQEAEKTFTEVIDEHANLQNRARGWFYLGKLAYQKDNIATAQASLAKVDKHLNRQLHDELVFLHEKIALADTSRQLDTDTNFSGELSFKPKLSKQSIYRYYRDYNRAVSGIAGDTLSNNADTWQASAKALNKIYRELKQSEDIAHAEELLGLRDKVLTSLGYLYLKLGDDKAAIASFRKVRQDSAQAGKALVGYGWATINAGDYEAALTPWLALQSRSMAESSTHEALLAVPFIYEEVELNQQALSAYDLALEKMQSELAALVELGRDIDSEGYLARFASGISGASKTTPGLLTGGHWLDAEASLIEPDALDTSPLKAHLSELLASSTMRTLFGQLNDIYWLEDNLQSWQTRLETFDFAVQERQIRSQAVLSGAAEDQLVLRLDSLQQQRDQLATLLAQANELKSDAAIELLLDDKELKSLRRIESAIAKLDEIDQAHKSLLANANNQQLEKLPTAASKQKVQSQRQQLNKMQQMLYWQASANRVERLWNKEKSMLTLDKVLAEARSRVTRFPALATELTEQAGYLQRLDLDRQRITTKLNTLGFMRSEVESKLAARLHDEIRARENRLKAYVGQVKLSKAVLLERHVGDSL